MLRVVVFDADETLLDLRPAVTGGLVAVLEEMRRLAPAAAALSLADLESDWHAVFGERSAAPVQQIRQAALARSLARAGLDAHLDDLTTLFFTRRFALTRPFADALPALAALREPTPPALPARGPSGRPRGHPDRPRHGARRARRGSPGSDGVVDA
ncbi:hypothetical protein B0E53_02304 [Micromonospora sp. MH33]|nr:hypothetical protein B0E53_02304 [Micromonospora sp. MH33]